MGSLEVDHDLCNMSAAALRDSLRSAGTFPMLEADPKSPVEGQTGASDQRFGAARDLWERPQSTQSFTRAVMKNAAASRQRRLKL
jgi:hypothetical protein